MIAVWGIYCNPHSDQGFHPGQIVKVCAIQQGSALPVIRQSPEMKPTIAKKEGLGLGFDSLLSEWARDAEIVCPLIPVAPALQSKALLRKNKPCKALLQGNAHCCGTEQALTVPALASC